MRVTIVCVGSRGDVQPYVALGAGLRERGYHVTIATHSEFLPLVHAEGLELSSVEGNPREILNSEEGRKWIESDRNSFAFFAGIISVMRSMFERLTDDVWNGCANADAILYSPLAICAHSVAEKLKVPSCLAVLQPVTQSAAYASPVFPPVHLGKAYNLMTHKAARQFIWQPFRKLFNQWRRNVLNLSPYPFWGPFVQLHDENATVLHAFSRHILPRPQDWRTRSYLTGYWFLNHQRTWQPPPELLRFLEDGGPAVYVGFGSMSERDPAALTDVLVRALRLSKRRAILLSGWAGLPKENLPDNILVVDSVPHDWLFPRLAAVVHHGGAGTTGAAFRAGVPQVVIPFFGDQHFWASRAYHLGVGARPIPRRKLTADQLADAIRYAATDETLRVRAQAMGASVSREDGVRRAIEILESEVFPLRQVD